MSVPTRVCTQKGRVVYNRKPTLFTYRDLFRIAKSIPAPDLLEFKERYWLIRTYAVLGRKATFLELFGVFDEDRRPAETSFKLILEDFVRFFKELGRITELLD